MKHGDIARSTKGFMIGKVIKTDTECAIRSLDDSDYRWIVRASNLNQFKKEWKVIRPSPGE